MTLVIVDEGVCSRVAARISGIKVRMEPEARLLEDLDRETALRVLFFFSVINYDTRGLSGVVKGRYVRGSNYLLYLLAGMAEEDPGLLDPARIAELELGDFLSWFGPLEEARGPRRPTERVMLLRDAAEKLLAYYGGRVSALLDACSGRMGGSGGLRERLSAFKAFDDPLAKKTMVFAILAKKEGLWEPVDPENITVGIDYHLQRVALRSGMIKVVDEKLLEKLRARRFVSAEEHNAIRSACLDAYTIVSRCSGLSQLEVDQLFWHLGRSCCLHAEEPACREKPCYRSKTCSLISATDYECEGYCPLDGTCEASLDPEKIRLVEPKVITYYY